MHMQNIGEKNLNICTFRETAHYGLGKKKYQPKITSFSN